jgi:hypothetical protein
MPNISFSLKIAQKLAKIGNGLIQKEATIRNAVESGTFGG